MSAADRQALIGTGLATDSPSLIASKLLVERVSLTQELLDFVLDLPFEAR
jgi:hypothetical protein